MDSEAEIPAELLEPPAGSVPPPVETAALALPIGSLAPEDFEKLCLRLARLEGMPFRSRRYGTPGQKQYGIDIYSRLPCGRYATYQCKRYKDLDPSDFSNAVDKFLDGTWAARSERFVFCTTASVDRTQLQEAAEVQGDRLTGLQPPIEWEVWDAEVLSERLRGHEDIVSLFFGPHWVRRFFGREGLPAVSGSELAAIVQDAVASASAPQLVSTDWAPTSLRLHLEDLRVRDPGGFSRLSDHLGNPPEGVLVAAATSAPPPWLRDADEATWDLTARIAEALGEWPAAARAWVHVAQMRVGPAAAGPLARAAVAAEAGGDDAEHARLLQAASIADEHNPRVVLAGWDEGGMALADQLALLDGLRSADSEELGLIAARRTLVHALLSDTAAARDALTDARRFLPGSALVDGLEVSVTVQEGRLAVLDHRTLDRGALRAAAEQAVAVREGLLEQRRYSESTRLLMLRADIHALLGERNQAASILRKATPDERVSQEQKEVLADSATSRALDYELGLEFLDGAADTPTALRIRLECLEEIGSPAERQTALDGLDHIVSSGGPQAPEAAFQRLAATLGRKPTPWSEEAAAYLRSNGHERAAVTAEAMYRVEQAGWAPVEQLLRPYGQTPWALAVALRASLHQRVDAHVAVASARAMLAIGPGHALRIDAARGLLRGGDLVAAREVLVGVARDPNAPDTVRSDAYHELMQVVGRQLGEWPAAGILHDEWVRLRPTDTRAQSWAPTIANRRRPDIR